MHLILGNDLYPSTQEICGQDQQKKAAAAEVNVESTFLENLAEGAPAATAPEKIISGHTGQSFDSQHISRSDKKIEHGNACPCETFFSPFDSCIRMIF